MWLGNNLPSGAEKAPWQVLQLAEEVGTPSGATLSGTIELFELLYQCTSGAVLASMLAYIAAQFCDVQLFHFFKKLTRGKHLWLRNNFSTLISQMVDSFMVITVTFGAAFLAGSYTVGALLFLMFSNYLFKLVVALLDTIPFYLITGWLRRTLQMPLITEEAAKA